MAQQETKKYLLALDQSTQITGYALFEDGALINHGIISPSDSDYLKRISQLQNELKQFVSPYLGNIEIALEDIQLQTIPGQPKEMGVTTFKKLAHAQAGVILTCIELEIPYRIISSNSWKSTCEIKGKSRTDQKHNAALFVKNKYNLTAIQDVCDAICIGTHVLSLGNHN